MSLKQKTRSGIAWNTFVDFLILVLRFGGGIVLARLLFPEDFGLMGVAMIFINFAKRLANFGFNAALIQKRNIDRFHIDSIFWFNFVLYGVISGLVVISAPLMKDFFNNAQLRGILMVIALSFFIESLSGVPGALLNKKFYFKQVALTRLFHHLVNIGFAIAFALLGFGVWSLVFGILAGNVTRLGMLMGYAHWFPRFRFSWQRLKYLSGFGAGVSIANYLNYFINNVDYFVISKFLGINELGYYERAFNLMNTTRRRISRNMNSVLFSTYSEIQERDDTIRQGLEKVFQAVAVVSYPVHGLLFFIAPALIYNLYGPRWIPTILPLQIMSISGLINSLVIVFTPVIMAKAKIFQWIAVQSIYFLLLTILIYFSLPMGIAGVAGAVVASSLIYLFAMIYLISTFLEFGYRDFLRIQRDIWLYFAPSVLVTGFIQYVFFTHGSPYSIVRAIVLTVSFILSLLFSHVIWKRRFVSEFLTEIGAFFKK